MHIYPDFFKKFICTGSNCLNTCCNGWKVNIDQKTLDYYNGLEDDFGQFIQQNLTQHKDKTCIKLDDQGHCPFLDEEGLCNIFIHYGEEHMSDTCQFFPRQVLKKGDNSMYCLFLTCEEVLHILYTKPEPIRCCVEGTPNIKAMDDLMIYELSQFIAWGIELLQDPSIPFSVCLGTVIYVGMTAEESFKKKDYESFKATILQAPEILTQFQESKKEFSKNTLADVAWPLIFCLTDSFCTIMKEANMYNTDSLLWDPAVFEMNDDERKNYLIACHEKRNTTPQHNPFMRRVAAVSFFSRSMALEKANGESLYLQGLCNYLILMDILPLTWNLSPDVNIKQYLARMSDIARNFEQSNLIKEFVYSTVHDLVSPDLFTYVMTFMFLFDD